MLIDHRRLYREALRLVLESRSVARIVGIAEDARTGLDLVLTCRPDVVLIDTDAPGPTALDLASAAREAGVSSAFVLIGPSGTAAWVDFARDPRIAGYLSTGDEPQAVMDAVRTAAGGGRYISPVARRHGAERAQPWLFEGEPRPRVADLSPREIEVFVQLARGLSMKQVAALLSLSVKTVDNHAQHLMAKLRIHSRAELVRLAIRERLLTA
ncbi:MAG: LuxR C-terminal-related transcriptional regulator [Phycisphaerales bacterium]